MIKKFKTILKNKNGQGVMEYIILSTLVGIFCLVAIKSYGVAIKKQINHMKKQINSISRN